MSNFNQKLIKTTGEIRFRPTLTSLNENLQFAKDIESEFEHWRVTNRNDVVLFSPDSKSLIKMKYDSIMFLNEEGQQSTDALISSVKRIFSKMISNSGVNEFRHIGCRRQYIIETKFNYTDLTDLTFRKFYANQDFLQEASADKIMDTLFVLDGKKGDLRNHVQVGPVLKDQALQTFAPAFEYDELEDKAFIFFDVDVFKNDNISSENALMVLDRAIENNSKIVDYYLKYVTGQ